MAALAFPFVPAMRLFVLELRMIIVLQSEIVESLVITIDPYSLPTHPRSPRFEIRYLDHPTFPLPMLEFSTLLRH
jgi:hypothetical protein